MSAPISYLGLALCVLLLLPVIIAAAKLKLGLNKTILISVLRMGVQLTLALLYLNLLIYYDNILLNIAYIFIMVLITCFSVIKGSHLKIKHVFLNLFLAIAIPGIAVLIYFNALVLELDNIFTAKYLITIGGMILGNCLRSVIVSIDFLLMQVVKKELQYKTALIMGASKAQALAPFVAEALKKSLSPIIESMAATGIVALPGMTTGQILGGADPQTAIMYQFAILIAIFVSQFATSYLSLYFMSRSAFDGYSLLKKEIFA